MRFLFVLFLLLTCSVVFGQKFQEDISNDIRSVAITKKYTDITLDRGNGEERIFVYFETCLRLGSTGILKEKLCLQRIDKMEYRTGPSEGTDLFPTDTGWTQVGPECDSSFIFSKVREIQETFFENDITALDLSEYKSVMIVPSVFDWNDVWLVKEEEDGLDWFEFFDEHWTSDGTLKEVKGFDGQKLSDRTILSGIEQIFR